MCFERLAGQIGNPAQHHHARQHPLQWLIALCVAVAFATIALTVRSLVVRKLKHRASDTAGLWDDWIVAILPGTRSLLVFAIAAWVGGQLLALPSTYGRGLDRSLYSPC